MTQCVKVRNRLHEFARKCKGSGFAHSNLHFICKFHLASQKVQTSGLSRKAILGEQTEKVRRDDRKIGGATQNVRHCAFQKGLTKLSPPIRHPSAFLSAKRFSSANRVCPCKF